MKTNVIPMYCAPFARKYWLKRLNAESIGHIDVFAQSHIGSLTPLLLLDLMPTRKDVPMEFPERELKNGLPMVFHGESWNNFTKLGLSRLDFERHLNILAVHGMLDMLVAAVQFCGSEQRTAAQYILDFFGITPKEYDYDTLLQMYKTYRVDGHDMPRRQIGPRKRNNKPKEQLTIDQ
jgi:hypothetical protein